MRGVGEQAERGGLDRFPESEHPAGPLRSRGAGSGSSPGGSRGDKTGEITRRGGSTPPESNPVSGANTLSGETGLKEARATERAAESGAPAAPLHLGGLCLLPPAGCPRPPVPGPAPRWLRPGPGAPCEEPFAGSCS